MEATGTPEFNDMNSWVNGVHYISKPNLIFLTFAIFNISFHHCDRLDMIETFMNFDEGYIDSEIM